MATACPSQVLAVPPKLSFPSFGDLGGTTWEGQQEQPWPSGERISHRKDRNSPFTTWQGQKFAIYYLARTKICLLLRGKDRNSPSTTWQGQNFAIYYVARTEIRHLLLPGKDKKTTACPSHVKGEFRSLTRSKSRIPVLAR